MVRRGSFQLIVVAGQGASLWAQFGITSSLLVKKSVGGNFILRATGSDIT